VSSRAELTRLLDALYVEPNQCDTIEEFDRARHRDIVRLNLEAIDAEHTLAKLRWADQIHRHVEPTPWLRDRIARLEQEATRRRRGEGERR
jgi:hypothetical protein